MEIASSTNVLNTMIDYSEERDLQFSLTTLLKYGMFLLFISGIMSNAFSIPPAAATYRPYEATKSPQRVLVRLQQARNKNRHKNKDENNRRKTKRIHPMEEFSEIATDTRRARSRGNAPTLSKTTLPPSKKHIIPLETAGESFLGPTTFSVVAYQIEDRAWWEDQSTSTREHERDCATTNNSKTNPYGARLWPSALGLAQFLVKMDQYTKELENKSDDNLPVESNGLSQTSVMKDFHVLELGCGGGICSIVAASLGAKVTASDISDTVLRLTQKGWMATQKRIMKKMNKKKDLAIDDDVEAIALTTSMIGSLTTLKMDLFSKEPLSLPHPSTQTSNSHNMVVAAAMLYSSDLAIILARRAYEAIVEHNAWVIIGDDDSGQREGGRNLFFQEWKRLWSCHEDNSYRENMQQPIITISTVQHDGLKWREKKIQLIHLNPPNNITGFIDEVRGM